MRESGEVSSDSIAPTAPIFSRNAIGTLSGFSMALITSSTGMFISFAISSGETRPEEIPDTQDGSCANNSPNETPRAEANFCICSSLGSRTPLSYCCRVIVAIPALSANSFCVSFRSFRIDLMRFPKSTKSPYNNLPQERTTFKLNLSYPLTHSNEWHIIHSD